MRTALSARRLLKSCSCATSTDLWYLRCPYELWLLFASWMEDRRLGTCAPSRTRSTYLISAYSIKCMWLYVSCIIEWLIPKNENLSKRKRKRVSDVFSTYGVSCFMRTHTGFHHLPLPHTNIVCFFLISKRTQTDTCQTPRFEIIRIKHFLDCQ